MLKKYIIFLFIIGGLFGSPVKVCGLGIDLH